MPRKKSSFYHTRIRAELLNVDKTAELLGVKAEQVLEWDYKGAPVMAERLLSLYNRKYIDLPEWEGFCFSRGKLRYKDRQIFTGRSILLERERANELWDAQQALIRKDKEIEKLKSWRGLSTVFVDKVVDTFAKGLGLPRVEVRLVKR